MGSGAVAGAFSEATRRRTSSISAPIRWVGPISRSRHAEKTPAPIARMARPLSTRPTRWASTPQPPRSGPAGCPGAAGGGRADPGERGGGRRPAGGSNRAGGPALARREAAEGPHGDRRHGRAAARPFVGQDGIDLGARDQARAPPARQSLREVLHLKARMAAEGAGSGCGRRSPGRAPARPLSLGPRARPPEPRLRLRQGLVQPGVGTGPRHRDPEPARPPMHPAPPARGPSARGSSAGGRHSGRAGPAPGRPRRNGRRPGR